MQLSQFHSLIASMPVPYQAFESKRSTWDKFIHQETRAGNALRGLFGNDNQVNTSRHDLKVYAQAQDLAPFVMATILWGYPAGMRGNHFANIIANLDTLLALLNKARDSGVSIWDTHFEKTKIIPGLGLSTYTKFLQFLGVKVHGQPALILDDRIIRVAQNQTFAELAPINNLKSYNASRNFPAYLNCIHSLAEKNDLPAENIEFFLFEYGTSLKEPGGQIR